MLRTLTGIVVLFFGNIAVADTIVNTDFPGTTGQFLVDKTANGTDGEAFPSYGHPLGSNLIEFQPGSSDGLLGGQYLFGNFTETTAGTLSSSFLAYYTVNQKMASGDQSFVALATDGVVIESIGPNGTEKVGVLNQTEKDFSGYAIAAGRHVLMYEFYSNTSGSVTFDLPNANLVFTPGSVASVPEPGVWALVVVGLVGVGVGKRPRGELGPEGNQRG